jgi:hypothetical protein
VKEKEKKIKRKKLNKKERKRKELKEHWRIKRTTGRRVSWRGRENEKGDDRRRRGENWRRGSWRRKVEKNED